MWWMSVQRGGRSQPGKAQPPSREQDGGAGGAGERASGPAYIDGDAGAVEEGGQDGGVAGEASGGCGGEQLPGVELADGYVAL